MGDRTYVTLTVRRKDEAAVRRIYDAAEYGPEDRDQDPDDAEFVHIGFGDVNYGELPFLDELEKAGIPFDSSWASGSEYGEGTRYGRYDENGDLVPVEMYDTDYSIPIGELRKRISDYTELATYIRKKWDGLQVLSWESQALNAKLFRTKQLINPE